MAGVSLHWADTGAEPINVTQTARLAHGQPPSGKESRLEAGKTGGELMISFRRNRCEPRLVNLGPQFPRRLGARELETPALLGDGAAPEVPLVRGHGQQTAPTVVEGRKTRRLLPGASPVPVHDH